MRKILSFVAAMFVALAVNAQELPSTDFAAPGYSCAADAAVLSGTATELSGKFYLDETASPHHIAWSDLSKQYTAVATWHFHASRACYVTVTLDLGPVIASNKHIFDVELHAANGDRLDTIAEGPNYTGDGFTDANVQKTLEGQILIPAAGDYYIELRNNRDWCKGSIKNVILTYAADAPVIGAPAYYLVGNMNNWTPDSAYMFAVNPANENEYMLNTTLAVGDSVKVLGIVGNTQTWYPDNAPNYGVDAAHAGEKTIYFQTTYKADWAEFGGYMWMEANPQPKATLDFTANTTWNFPTDAKAVAAAAFSDGTYSITLEGTSGNGYRWYSNGNYLLNGKEGATITLPAFTWKTTKIVVTGNSGASGSTKMNIFVGNSAVSTETTGSKGVNTYEIAEAYQDPGNVYVLKVTSDHNAQFTKIEIYGEDAPEPQGCDWDNIEFLGDVSIEQTYANQFKVCKDGDVPTVVNIQTPGFATGTGIYMTFPDAVIGNISLPADQYKIEGAGVIFYLTAFTAKETEVTLQWQNGVYSFTVLNVNGTEPQPEVNYSLKNNWDAAADWTWKEMTKDGDNYKLENVVFGGTGVNYQADLPGAPEMWVPMADFLGDKVDAKDTVTFVLNPADSTITATLIGKYIEPAPELVVVYNWAKETADQVGATIFGGNSNITTGTVKIHENSDDVNGIKFGSSYVYADGKWIAIKPAEGGFKAGDILSVSVVFNNSDATKYCMVDLRAADGDTRIWMSDSLSTLNGRNAGDPIVQTYTLEADQDSLFLGRYGNTGMFITLLKVDRAVTPEPVHTYTVAGAPATLFGQEWTPSYAANDLEPIVGGEYTHGWKKDSVALAAGEVTFKIVEDHAWAHAWPAQNYVLNIPEDGLYNISILFNQYAEADSLRISAIAQKVGEAVVIPTVVMHGNFTGTWADTKAFTLAADSLTASLRLGLEAKAYEFGMKFDGVWKANGANITREAPSACLATGDGNMHITADQAGEYIFTYTFATQTLEVAYPKIIKHYGVAEAIAAAADSVLVKDDLVYIRGIVTKIEFKGKNFAKYGSACIYVADAAGAADTLEFYNCYSMNADTFKTSDPAYDATSTAWAQFNSVSDANGNTVALGDVVEAFGKYNLYNGVHQLNQGCYITEIHTPSVAPTTAPAAPTQAEEDVMAIYCDYYKTNNLHFGISGWAGAYETLNIEDTKIAYWKAMTWECVIDPVNTDSIHDLSAYKKLHVDFWAPAAAKIKFTAEAVAGGNYKDGVVLDLAEGWTSWDIEIATWPGQYDFANLKCLVLEQYQTPEGASAEGNPMAFANVYFYEKEAQGFENIDASVKAVKVLYNGQILILRGDKVYTVTGQPIAK